MNRQDKLSLAQRLAQLIEREGPVSVATFMEIALGDPRRGYYAANPGIGALGDFITAPEVSQLFGEMIGIFVLQSWLDLDRPAHWQLIELGPGRGTLMQDLLRVLKLRAQAFESVEIHLVETSSTLRAAQAEALSSLGVAPHWHSELGEIPDAVGVIVANEFFDALPIRQFLRAGPLWYERRIGLRPGSTTEPLQFDFVAVPSLDSSGSERKTAREGEIIEQSQAARAMTSQIGSRLKRAPGRALIIDYGYDGARHGDTLQAVRHHRKVDVLEDVGLADVTAHVDFAALRNEACRAGAASFGSVTQCAFLQNLGIEERFRALAACASAAERARLERQLERLTAPEEMGELFRALSLSSPGLPRPPGFP